MKRIVLMMFILLQLLVFKTHAQESGSRAADGQRSEVAERPLNGTMDFDFGDFIDFIDRVRNGDEGRGRPNRPPHGGYGPVRCQYDDEGWEEHRYGHNSCRECLSYHGDCIETCSTQEVTCTAVGDDSRGRQTSVTVVAPSQWEAERRAYDSCRYRGLNNCHIQDCDTEERTLSRRRCR